MNRILIIGINGMLGNTVLRFFCNKKNIEIAGTVRNASSVKGLVTNKKYNLFDQVCAEDHDSFLKVFNQFNPNVVINCIGIVKQIKDSNDSLKTLLVNSVLPHYLANLSQKYMARFIHISTDCVFSGSKGNYVENDVSDADDLYGRSKLLGEVNHSNAITLRTSIIGPELIGCHSLLNWFLSQKKHIKGFKKAIFSGFPTYEIARIIDEYVIPNSDLRGLYHISSEPISKLDLLLLVKSIYNKNIEIIPDETMEIDRSLDSSLFRKNTGFHPKPWNLMIKEMRNFG
jgi:dTDP-4-dehydrorhamnose reductase